MLSRFSRAKNQPQPVEPALNQPDAAPKALVAIAPPQPAEAETTGKFTDINYYVEVGKEMALELSRFYHPGAKDPVGSLTIPEILAVVELAAHDLAEMVDQYLPGGHLLTINNWKQARQAADWYQTASNVYWLASALLSPLNTGLRYAASQLGMSRPLQMLQQNLLLWFYTAFVQRLGTYLIDLNSGRLQKITTETRPYMRGGEIVHRTALSPG